MKIRRWLGLRSPGFIRKRAVVLLERYGLTPAKAIARIEANVGLLAEYGCAPSFPTPGRVVEYNAAFLRRIQERGAEIAVHSFDHVDLKGYPTIEAVGQLVKAARVFEQHGIEVHGFRCPYLSCPDDLVDMLPDGKFGYSSNEAVWWDVNGLEDRNRDDDVFETLNYFYSPRSAHEAVSMPYMRGNRVEIPVCIPDDLQLHDGLRLSGEQIGVAWRGMLRQTYRRGELFTLIFHPELAERCEDGFRQVLGEANQLEPRVWLARLRDIADWWKEKAGFTADIVDSGNGWRICFERSSRGTVLARGLGPGDAGKHWDGPYYEIKSSVLEVPGGPLPFVGISSTAVDRIATFLREQGYILVPGDGAQSCATVLDDHILASLKSEVDLIRFIEDAPGPLVKFSRWPGGAKSAMCVSGDLDALSLMDYASRLTAG